MQHRERSPTFPRQSTSRALKPRDDVGAGPAIGPRRRRPGWASATATCCSFPDLVALTVSATLGATVLNVVSPIRAGDLNYRDVLLVVVSMAVSLNLHGLYRRPRITAAAERVVATFGRCPVLAHRPYFSRSVSTRSSLPGGSRMTLTAAVCDDGGCCRA